MILPGLMHFLGVCVAWGCLGGFVAMYAFAIFWTWKARDKAPEFADPFLHFATVLAGMVGTSVAAGFHLKLPQSPSVAEAMQKLPHQLSMAETFQTHFEKVGYLLVSSQPDQWQLVLGGSYAIAYLLLGAAAIVTWVSRSRVTPDVVKNLANISFGLMAAIGTASLSG